MNIDLGRKSMNVIYVKKPLSISSVLLSVLFLAGCNSHIPEKITSKPLDNINYQQIENNRSEYENQYVRWGGKIVSVENKVDITHIEILANPLNSFGRPIQNDKYKGRFIAAINGFLDPEFYTKGRSLTVYGKLQTPVVKNIDEHPYEYPLINVEEHYLWKNNRNLYRDDYYLARYKHHYLYTFPRFYPRFYYRY